MIDTWIKRFPIVQTQGSAYTIYNVTIFTWCLRNFDHFFQSVVCASIHVCVCARLQVCVSHLHLSTCISSHTASVASGALRHIDMHSHSRWPLRKWFKAFWFHISYSVCV